MPKTPSDSPPPNKKFSANTPSDSPPPRKNYSANTPSDSPPPRKNYSANTPSDSPPPNKKNSPKSPDMPPPPQKNSPKSPDMPPPPQKQSSEEQQAQARSPQMSPPRFHGKDEDSRKSKIPPQKQLDNLVTLFWENKPYIKDAKINHELEVRFGTMNPKPFTKIDYDNVIVKLKSLGFECPNQQGSFMMRIQTEHLDAATGSFKLSPIRAEINGFHGIQEYCKHNSIQKLLSEFNSAFSVEFCNKKIYSKDKTSERSYPVNFNDWNFRVTYSTEDHIRTSSAIIQNIISKWEKSKKFFRYINRVTFIHPDIPIKVDISIIKSSQFKNKEPILEYTTNESRVFQNPEVYEIELEIDNSQIGPGYSVDRIDKLLVQLRKTIKYVLMGLQGTNFPIPYSEQQNILQEYMKVIKGPEYKFYKDVLPYNFIGPSSYTLQIDNIMPKNDNVKMPNIRDNYTVTEKADGERRLLFISQTGKIYLINTNMQILFTGAETDNKDILNTLIDGEIIYHDKNGKFINLYAAFDIYFANKTDVRKYGFTTTSQTDVKTKFRLHLLKNIIKALNAKSVLKDEICPIRIESKQFYPLTSTDNIFDSCNHILGRVRSGLFEYNTDGLIFTPANMGVGADVVGKTGPIFKSTWEYSFKWKPAHFNTIDFLISTKKAENGLDIITPIFQEGFDAAASSQIKEYKTIILRCGFNEEKDGYLNPCQDVIDDVLPAVNVFNTKKDKSKYLPIQFIPTNPYDPTAGITFIPLKKDSTGVDQMFSEEGEVFSDNTIVEFRYDMDAKKGWRWIPLRVRFDKTTELRNGGANFGNAYWVANNNWMSIHKPITEEMILIMMFIIIRQTRNQVKQLVCAIFIIYMLKNYY